MTESSSGSSAGMSARSQVTGVRGQDAVHITFLTLINMLLRRRWLVLTLVPLTAILLVVATWLTRDFAARSVFVPQSSTSASRLGRLSGLAEQFGVDLGLGGGGESLDFYASLLTSREILLAACSTEFSVAATSRRVAMTGTLFDLYRVDGPSERRRQQTAVRKLERDVTVSSDLASGMVTLVVEAPWPDLAEALNRRLLDLLEDFNVHRRQSQAGAERAFLEQRIAVAGRELQAAENMLRDFYEQNRSYQESPRLIAEAARLNRQVELRQQVYIVLARALEESRIDEVRDTPVLTLVERPEGTAKPAVRLRTRGILGLVLGAALSLGIIFGGEHLARQRQVNPEEYRDFSELTRALVREVPPVGLVHRALRRGGSSPEASQSAGARTDRSS